MSFLCCFGQSSPHEVTSEVELAQRPYLYHGIRAKPILVIVFFNVELPRYVIHW